MYNLSIINTRNATNKEHVCDPSFLTFRQSNFSCLNIKLNAKLLCLNIYGERTLKRHVKSCIGSRWKYLLSELEKKYDCLHHFELPTLTVTWCQCWRRHNLICQFSTQLMYPSIFLFLRNDNSDITFIVKMLKTL